MTSKHPRFEKDEDGISALRAKLQKDASKFLKGVSNNDVDWFLRTRNLDNHHLPSSSSDSTNANANINTTTPTTTKTPVSLSAKSSATIASDGSDVLAQPSTTTSTPPSFDLANVKSNADKSFAASNPLHRSRTLEEGDRRSSTYALKKTSTNISQQSFSSSNSQQQPIARTRSHSISALKKASEPKKLGFFKKLFSSSDSTSTPSDSKTDLSIPIQKNSSTSINSAFPTPTSTTTKPAATSIPPNSSIDPKLEEYLKFYNKKRRSTLVNNNINNQSSSTFSSSSHISSAPPKLDEAGNPIPPHPPVSPLPPAITNSASNVSPTSDQQQQQQQQQQGKFGLLRRHHSTFSKPQQHSQSTEDDFDYVAHISSSNVANKEARIPPILYLQKIEPLRKVAFAADVFVHDPPQQIPSRHPREGNVEVLKDGTIKIHELDEEEKKKLQTHNGGGVVVGGSGHLRILTPEERKAAEERMTNDDNDDDKPKEEKTDDSKFLHKNEVQIDKPMVSRHKQYDDNGHYIMDTPAVKLQLDELYTRCCHLREILPIPAIVKQIPKGTTSPLLVLQLRNPKPSLIEVLAFSDFIRIAPIICISLDGVEMSEQMFRIILSLLVYKKHLEKLSLRNTPINEEGWKLLCWFLSVNKRLRRLDLTQCPSISINTQKLRDSAKRSTVKRMESSKNDRSDMDWSLMTATLISRGGIEEIILSGCKIKKFDVFKNFIEKAVSLITVKLGLAYNELTLKEIEIVAKLLENNDSILGLDIGYNDLSQGLIYFTNFSEQHFETSKLMFLSLNSTNLKPNQDTKKLIPSLSKLKKLKFLDLSNNKLLFPKMNDEIFSYLPLFPSLVRLHLDSNDLDSKTLVTVAETLTLCSRLNYISLLGNHLDMVSTIALVNALKASSTIFTLDIEFDEISPDLKEKIGLYTMRNMEQVLYSTNSPRDTSNPHSTDSISKRMVELLQSDNLSKENNKEVEDFLKNARQIKSQIAETIQLLFGLQTKNQLNLEGKESLIRLCFLDSALEKGLSLIGTRFNHVSHDISQYTTSQLLNAETTNVTDAQHKASKEVEEEEEPADVELKNDNVSEKISISRNSSSRSLRDLDRGEGSVLKLQSLISHHDRDKIEDQIMMDDEEIKKVLLNPVDLNLVTEVLTQIKKRGISLEEVFRKTSITSSNSSKSIPKNQQLNIDNLRRKLNSLKLDEISKAKPKSDTGSSSSNSITDQNTLLNMRHLDSQPDDAAIKNHDNIKSDKVDDQELDVESIASASTEDDDDDDVDSLMSLEDGDSLVDKDAGESAAINETYDSLLKDLVKVKTNTN